MSVVSTIMYFFLILIGILRRNSYLVKILLLAFVWILIGLNTYSPDYDSYEAVYNGTYYGLNMDVGFRMCCEFFSSLGLSYQQFRMVWGLFYVCLLYNFISRNTKSPNLVLSLMLICPVLLDVSGIRSSVAYLIALNFSLLLKNPTFRRKVIYTLGVFLASTIHITAIFYLIFLMIGVTLNKKQIMLITFGITATSIMVYTPIFREIASTLYNITGIYAIQKWLLGGSTNTYPNIIGILSVAVFLVAYVWILIKESNLYQLDNFENKGHEKSISYLKSLGIFVLFLLPIIMISTEGRRLLFGVLVVFYCMTGNIFTEKDRSLVYTYTTFKFMLAEIIVSIATLWMYMYSYQSHDVMAVLRDNLIWGLGH